MLSSEFKISAGIVDEFTAVDAKQIITQIINNFTVILILKFFVSFKILMFWI